jgi:hypothetical protein
MVTTVTVSTVTAIAASSLAIGIAIFATLLLIGFLTGKELLGASPANRHKFLARALNISIIPLVIAFVIIVGMKVAELLV